MEEHGVLKALLRQKEQELTEATTQHTESQTQIEDLEARLKASEEKVGRSDRKVILAEREASFLQAMMVCPHNFTTIMTKSSPGQLLSRKLYFST